MHHTSLGILFFHKAIDEYLTVDQESTVTSLLPTESLLFNLLVSQRALLLWPCTRLSQTW